MFSSSADSTVINLIFKCYSHHEEDSRHDESRVSGVCKNVPYEGWQVLFYSLHDHIIHLLLTTVGETWIKYNTLSVIKGIQLVNVIQF